MGEEPGFEQVWEMAVGMGMARDDDDGQRREASVLLEELVTRGYTPSSVIAAIEEYAHHERSARAMDVREFLRVSNGRARNLILISHKPRQAAS